MDAEDEVPGFAPQPSVAPKAAPQVKKARNCLTYGVAPKAAPKDALWLSCLQWWEERGTNGAAQAAIDHMGNIIFKKVRLQVPEDLWHEDLPTEVAMVVSRQYTAQRVRATLEIREQFLQTRGLPLNTVMDDGLIQQFLAERKKTFKAEPAQVKMAQKDRSKTAWRSRWSRRMQLLCGSKQF